MKRAKTNAYIYWTTCTSFFEYWNVYFRFVLKNNNGYEAHIISYGGIITNLYAPDKLGNIADIVLGFDSFDGMHLNATLNLHYKGGVEMFWLIMHSANFLSVRVFCVRVQTADLKSTRTNHVTSSIITQIYIRYNSDLHCCTVKNVVLIF